MHHKTLPNSTSHSTNSNKNTITLNFNQAHSHHKMTTMTNPKIKMNPTIYNNLMIILHSRSILYMKANCTSSSPIICQIIQKNIPTACFLKKWSTENIHKGGEMGLKSQEKFVLGMNPSIYVKNYLIFLGHQNVPIKMDDFVKSNWINLI